MSVFAQGGGLQSDLVFAEIGRRIEAVGSELVKKVNAVFSWEITKEGKTAAQWSTYACQGGLGGGFLDVNVVIPCSLPCLRGCLADVKGPRRRHGAQLGSIHLNVMK